MLTTVTWQVVRWLATVLVNWADNRTNYHAPCQHEVFVNTVLGALLFSSLIVGVHEAVYYINRFL